MNNLSIEPKPYFRISTLLAGVIFLVGLGHSQADEVDNYVRRQMERHQIPGLSLAVIKEGKIIKAKGGRDVLWCHPAFAHRHAYVHNGRELICVSLVATKAAGKFAPGV